MLVERFVLTVINEDYIYIRNDLVNVLCDFCSVADTILRIKD